MLQFCHCVIVCLVHITSLNHAEREHVFISFPFQFSIRHFIDEVKTVLLVNENLMCATENFAW